MIRLFFLLLSSLLTLVSSASAESLFVPTSDGFFVTDLSQRQEPRKVPVPGGGVPVLAVHPESPVLATVTDSSGVVFWNLPSLQVASRNEDTLYKGVVDMGFSQDGNRLYLLSGSLKSVLVFDLASNEISSVWPLVGSKPLALSVKKKGVLVHQSDGAILLDPSKDGAVLAQFRFESPVLASHLAGDYLYLAVQGVDGLQVYRLADGKRFQKLGATPYSWVVSKRSGGVFLLSESHGLESWSKDRKQIWGQKNAKRTSRFLASGNEQWLYLFAPSENSVALWSASAGQPVGKLDFPGVLLGVPRIAPF